MKLVLIALLIAFVSLPSQAADRRRTNLKGLGLYNFTMPKSDNSATQDTLKAKGAIGGGVLAEFPLGRAVGLEIGGLCQPYKYAVENAAINTNLTTEWRDIHLPLAFKFHTGSVLSFGLGGYYNFAIGKSKTTGTLTGSAIDVESDVSDDLKSDYGALGTIGFDLMLGRSMAFVLEGRYLWGLKKVAGQTQHHVQGLGGFSFLF